LAAATRRYKATSCYAFNEGRKLRWKLVNPYLLKYTCECSGKMGMESDGEKLICKECGV
jgi:hypothetical protein